MSGHEGYSTPGDPGDPYRGADMYALHRARTDALDMAVRHMTSGVPPGRSPMAADVLELAELYEAWLTIAERLRADVVQAARHRDTDTGPTADPEAVHGVLVAARAVWEQWHANSPALGDRMRDLAVALAQLPSGVPADA